MKKVYKDPFQEESQYEITNCIGVSMLHHPNEFKYVAISPIEKVLETFKQEVVKQNKSATIVEQEDGSVKMTIHGK
jgi:hypothetical protein